MELKDLQELVVRFRNKRDWKQFHNPKDLAVSLSLEVSELLEHFQWKTNEEVTNYFKERKNKTAFSEELADVFYYTLLLSEETNVNLSAVLKSKIRSNEKKYPIRKSKGNHRKYTEL